jgi:hypothetical protein
MATDLLNNHLNKIENGWSLSLKDTDAGIQIPEKLALLIKPMLEWEDNRSDEKTAEILRKINCHKVVLYLAGLISYDDFIHDPRLEKDTDFTYEKRASVISTKEFITVKNETELRRLAISKCEVGKMYVGQIFNETLGHSFLVGRTEDNKFICFDKAGFAENPLKGNKDFKFRVYEIGMLLGSPNYQNASWRFISNDRM